MLPRAMDYEVGTVQTAQVFGNQLFCRVAEEGSELHPDEAT